MEEFVKLLMESINVIAPVQITMDQCAKQVQNACVCVVMELFPKWSKTFIEFSDFIKFSKSLKHELGLT